MNLVSNRASVDLAQQAYASEPDLIGPLVEHPIRIHFKEINGTLYVIPEGSRTKSDWIDNFRTWADPLLPKVAHEDGFIPEGFYFSCASVVDQLVPRLTGRTFGIIGHSRGGAQGAVLTKLLLDRSLIASKLYLLEPARAYIFKIPTALFTVTIWGTWNGNDPVPHMPIGQQFSLQKIGRPMLDPFDCHHLASVAMVLDAIGVA